MRLPLLLLALTMSVPRIDPTAFVLPDGRVAIIGGSERTTSVDVVDTARGVVEMMENALPVPIAAAAATLLPDGKLLLTGGSFTRERYIHGGTWGNDHIVAWDPAGYFGSLGRLAHPRMNHQATLLADGRVLITGGNTRRKGGPFTQTFITNTTEIFDPTTGVSRFTGSMRTGRYGHTATLLPDGRVLVAGGAEAQPYPVWPLALATTEIFDPITETFSPGPEMSTPRIEHTATLLDDGRVLIAGGRPRLTYPIIALGTSEIFDPTTNTFATGADAGARYGHTATRLRDGRIFFYGGTDENPRRDHDATLLPDGRVLISGGTVNDVELVTPTATRRRAASR